MQFCIVIALFAVFVEGAVGFEVEVKRLHSRHRRFVGPGSRWDLLGGVEVLYDDAEIRFDIVIKYEMDYLFGGTTALAAQIAANEAAAAAAAAAEASVNAGREMPGQANMQTLN